MNLFYHYSFQILCFFLFQHGYRRCENSVGLKNRSQSNRDLLLVGKQTSSLLLNCKHIGLLTVSTEAQKCSRIAPSCYYYFFRSVVSCKNLDIHRGPCFIVCIYLRSLLQLMFCHQAFFMMDICLFLVDHC